MLNRYTHTTTQLLTLMLATIMSISCLTISGSATEDHTVGVRVNGVLVEFPDQAPYINSDGRTLIPVRFVAEQLGAEVTWNGDTRTATIKKDGITIQLPIGSNEMTVTENGSTRIVTMDTAAIISGGRTMVPIRFVAEALGAYVDYANAFRIVGIYQDVLTAEEIAELRSYPYTVPKNAITYEEYKSENPPDKVERMYGAFRETFIGNFANAHEYKYYLYSDRGFAPHRFDDLGKTVQAQSVAEYYSLLVAEAAAEIGYRSENLTITFRADQSCVYQADNHNYIYLAVRGFVTVTRHGKVTSYEESLIRRCGLTREPDVDVPVTQPLDIHLNIMPDYNVHIGTTVNPAAGN